MTTRTTHMTYFDKQIHMYVIFVTSAENIRIIILGSKIKIVADLWSDLSKRMREGH